MLSKDAVARKQIKKAQEKLEKRLREEDAEEKTSPPTIPHSVPSAPRKMKIKRKGLVQTNTPSTRSFEE
jgi:nitrate reductase cytochrome c-type subunit